MVFEIAHQVGLVPILGMLVMGRKLPRIYWLVALAFFVSWFADSAMHFIGGTWGAWYFFLPVQVWLVLVAFVDRATYQVAAAFALVLLALVSWGLSHPGPDQLVTILGSVAILYVMRGPLVWSLGIYFGAGTIARFFMVSEVGGSILPGWYAYQACRALGILIFIGIICPPVIHRLKGEQCG